MLRLLILACLYAVAFGLLGTGLLLGGSALGKGALPHPWLWIVVLLGGACLHRALQLTRRFGDPGAWRRPAHTPLSLTLAVGGFGSIGLASLFGGSSATGHVFVVIGGVLLIASGLSRRRD
jgi:hypothetical protein